MGLNYTVLCGTSWKFIFCALGLLFFHLVTSEETFKCPEQFGYYPDDQDCSKYYVCVFGDSLHEKCTGGLVFSVELQTCDWPRNVECSAAEKVELKIADEKISADEVFSSSRRTSSTLNNKQRSLNPDSLSNYQSFDTDAQRNYPKNTAAKSDVTKPRLPQKIQDTKLVSKLPSSVNPTNPPTIKPQNNPTTISDRPGYRGDYPSTIPEDPLYHGDERIKVSDPLSNYDPRQPDFDEAAPPLIDSEGGIHIADGGHGLDAFAGLSHLPGLGDYSVIAKPIYNENDKDENHKPRDQRKNTSNRNSASKSRNFENIQSSNARSKSTDTLVEYKNDKNDQSWDDEQNSYGTPLPTIFDDNADHRDYGRFDIITPLKTNIQADHDPNIGIDRVKIPFDNIKETKSQDLPINNRERTRSEAIRSNKPGSINNDHVSSNIPEKNSQFRSEIRDSAYAQVDHEIPRIVTSDENKYKLNKNTDLARFSSQDSRLNGQNKHNAQEPSHFNRKPENTQSYPLIESNFENNRMIENKRLQEKAYQDEINIRHPEEKSLEFQRHVKHNHETRSSLEGQRISNKHKDDESIIDSLDANFGIYTGNQRQNRKIEINKDSDNSKVIIPAESIQPSVRQPNQIRIVLPKDKTVNDKSNAAKDSLGYDGYIDYGEYESSKPHFSDDYFTNREENSETTTRTTTQLTKTRPTRPRKPITTTTTTTTSTTPAPIRIRSRRPISQTAQTGKPIPIPATSIPQRPPAVFTTPTPYQASQKCDPRKCKLPDCRCGGTDIPGGLLLEQTPQIVILTFDDAVNELNHDLYNELFDSGRVNPNGCPILATFYVSHEWTDYGQVQTLYSNGHEIASHSITHSYGEKFSKNQWMREIQGQREILHLYGGVKIEDIRGMRAPFLQIGGNKMFEMLYDANFTYDSSMPVYENNPPFWPYTLDYALNHECMIFPCPTKSYPGLWEIGMVMWVDLRGGRCSMGDACSNPSDEEAVSKMLMKNFNRHYKSSRAPFGLFYHSAWFNTQHHRRGFIKFLDEILKKDDVYLVTNWQLIQWMRDPVSLSEIKNYEPFDCRKLNRPPPCPSPTVCNVWYQGGVRYMKTCQPCPAKYPWIGNTGYENKG